MLKKEEVVSLLQKKRAVVSFIKKDGSKRVMTASLLEEDVKPLLSNTQKTDRTRKENPDVVCVVDVEKQQWRSFRLDSIVSIS